MHNFEPFFELATRYLDTTAFNFLRLSFLIVIIVRCLNVIAIDIETVINTVPSYFVGNW